MSVEVACSGHGYYLTNTTICECDPGWTGEFSASNCNSVGAFI